MKVENVEITHPDKILFPDSGITKRDVADYYQRMAEYMLPYIAARPLTLRQFPDGIEKAGFYGKHAPEHFPDFIRRLAVPMHSKSGKDMEMVMADETADLVYFAGQNTIEIHMGLSKSGALEKPDQIIFDLDPSDDDFEKVRKTAFTLKELLDEHDVPSFIKTTGSKGLHIHVPIKADHLFDEVKDVARNVAEELNGRIPGLTTMEQRKNKRGDKVFIDYLRNDYGMTAVAPYSMRAIKGAPVATPIDWDELKDPSLGPRNYTLSNIFRRLAQKNDPWKGFYRRKVKLKSIRLT